MTEKKKEIVGTVIRVAVAAVLFIVAIVNYDYLANLNVEELLGSIDNTGLVITVVLVLYLVKALIFVLPASVIYVAVGVILSPWLALLVNMLGIAIEVTVTYFLGRFLGGDFVKKLLSKKKGGKKILDMNLQDKKSVIFVTRLLPVFPIDFVSLLLGTSKSGFFMYFLLSVAGIFPRILLCTIIGDKLFELIPMDKLILIVICCIPIGVVVYLVKKYVIDKRHKTKESSENENDAEESE